MTHEYTITTNTDVSLTDLNDALDATTFNRVLTDRDQTATERTLIGDTTEYRARIYAADTEARADVLAELENAVSIATTASIEYRHTWTECDDTRRSNPDYYPSDMATGLRADVTLTNSGDYTSTTSAAYRIAGTNHEITDATHDHSPATDYVRIDRLVGTSDGFEVLEGQPHGNPAEVTTQPSAPDVPTDAVGLGTVVVKSHVDRIVHGGLTAETQPTDATKPEIVYEK